MFSKNLHNRATTVFNYQYQYRKINFVLESWFEKVGKLDNNMSIQNLHNFSRNHNGWTFQWQTLFVEMVFRESTWKSEQQKSTSTQSHELFEKYLFVYMAAFKKIVAYFKRNWNQQTEFAIESSKLFHEVIFQDKIHPFADNWNSYQLLTYWQLN